MLNAFEKAVTHVEGAHGWPETSGGQRKTCSIWFAIYSGGAKVTRQEVKKGKFEITGRAM